MAGNLLIDFHDSTTAEWKMQKFPMLTMPFVFSRVMQCPQTRFLPFCEENLPAVIEHDIL